MYGSSCFLVKIGCRRTLACVSAVLLLLLFHSITTAQGEIDLKNAVAAFSAGQELHEKGDMVGAIKLYEKALSIVPEFPEAEYQRGIAELSLGNVTQAERSFRRAADLRPDWSLALAKLGETMVTRLSLASPADAKGIAADARTALEKAIEIDAANAPALVALAELELILQSPPTAIAGILTKIRKISDDKSNVPASLWAVRAALEIDLGKRDLAKVSLMRAVAIDPKNRSAMFQLADFAIADGDGVKASELIDRIEGGVPTDQTRLYRARIFAADGRLDDAQKQLDSIVAKTAAANELILRIKALQTTNAADLEKQLATNPKNSAVLGRLCTIDRRDAPTKALDYCRRAAEAEPSNIHHAIGFGAALVQAKQYEAAEGLLRKIIAIAPDNSTAHANLATALFQLKRLPEAKAEFDWLANDQPKSPGAFLFLGIIHDQLGEFMDAMANYQQYLRLANAPENKLDIEKVNLRLPALQKLIKEGKGKRQ